MNLGGTIHITKTGCCALLGSVIVLLIYLLPSREIDVAKTSTKKVNLNHLLSVAIQAAEFGGKQVVDLLDDAKVSSKGKTKEGANDSVTTADFNSHCVILNTIKTVFPALTVISEENVVCNDIANEAFINLTLVKLKDEYVDEGDVKVWIDPLDATQEYTEKLTDFVTTMVCVAIRGKPVIGVIHKPFAKSTFWAWVGNGHSSNIIPKTSPDGGKLKFIVSRSHSGEVNAKIQALFKDRTGDIVPAGGAGYKVIEVVNGNADVYLHVTAIKKWDICSGNAVINSVGGKMTTLHGTEIDYADETKPKNEDGIVASMQQSLGVTFT